MCAAHSQPIVAFDEDTGDTLCEKCAFEGLAEKPVFMATVAQKLNKSFNEQYVIFDKACDELDEINSRQIWDEMQGKVTSFFNIIEDHVHGIENKVSRKIEDSTNLNSLIKSLEEMHAYMIAEGIQEKYDREKGRLDEKIGEHWFTYICRRKDHYNQVIKDMEKDNAKLVTCIKAARKMIDSILTIDQEIKKMEATLNSLVSNLIKIDEKHPEFGTSGDEEFEAQDPPSSNFAEEIQEELKEPE